jgi:intracellular sulfur oxidation DsrE/DsrF family protein
MRFVITFFLLVMFSFMSAAQSAAPVIPQADGFTIIANAKVAPDKNHLYKAIYDATYFAKDSSLLIPAINMAGSELNALAVSKIPLTHAKFVVIFHGAAVDGIMDDAHYRAKYGIVNPNLKTLAALKKAGVKLYVCGQHLLAEHIDPKHISPEVEVASDALIVLMTYQNDGYALMRF